MGLVAGLRVVAGHPVRGKTNKITSSALLLFNFVRSPYSYKAHSQNPQRLAPEAI